MHESKSGKSGSNPAARRTARATTGAAPRPRTKSTAPQMSAFPRHDEIRVRAYELYLQRDGRPGDPAEDWIRAERELMEQIASVTAAPAAHRASGRKHPESQISSGTSPNGAA
jgi:hypothetical protein